MHIRDEARIIQWCRNERRQDIDPITIANEVFEYDWRTVYEDEIDFHVRYAKRFNQVLHGSG